MVLWAHTTPRLTKYSSSLLKVAASASALPCIVYLYLHLHPLQLQLLRDDSPSQKANFSYSSCATQRPHAVTQRVAWSTTQPFTDLHPHLHLHVRRDYNTSLTLLCLVQRNKYETIEIDDRELSIASSKSLLQTKTGFFCEMMSSSSSTSIIHVPHMIDTEEDIWSSVVSCGA